MDRERFEALLGELSTTFSGLPAWQIDREVAHALGRLLDFLDIDRCTLAELRGGDGGEISVSHSVARPEVIETLTPSFPLAHLMPWLLARLRSGEVVRLDDIEREAPPEAASERSFAKEIGVLSHLAVPLAIGGRWICAIGLDSVRATRAWSDATVQRTRIVGQVLANALYRRDTEQALRASLEEVQRLERRLAAENEYLREEIESEAGFEQIVGKSAPLREVLAQVARVADTSATVLLLGETGTGKELLARAIHARSRRADRPLIRVNCAALPASLVESELFGHEKGAFTGATSAKPGRFELADGGTLFLDEVGEIPPEVQVKLLRVLQDGEFERVGGTRTRRADVRIVAATNRDLGAAIAAGGFREDLYYRLAAFPIQVPALRDRPEDVPLLVWDLIRRRQGPLGRRIEQVPEAAMRGLQSYAWPGNVRELANVVERALILSSGPVLCLEQAFEAAPRVAEPADRLDEVERAHVLRTLERTHWRINGPGNAAEVLGLHPNTLRSRMKRLGIARPAGPARRVGGTPFAP
jgi:formate hydrogenlyase transcriptional activator